MSQMQHNIVGGGDSQRSVNASNPAHSLDLIIPGKPEFQSHTVMQAIAQDYQKPPVMWFKCLKD